MTKKILIIEDDKSVAQLVSTYFLNEKWNVNVIHNGEDGLENAYENSYDLIVLDLMLPKLSGLLVSPIVVPLEVSTSYNAPAKFVSCVG